MGKTRRGKPRPPSPTLAERVGWPRCNRPCRLRAAFAFGEYDGPAVVVAEKPGTGELAPLVVVEFPHPKTGKPHQAVCGRIEVSDE